MPSIQTQSPKTFNIALFPGGGIGPELTDYVEALLSSVGRTRTNLSFDEEQSPFAIEVDAVFVETLPDRATIERPRNDLNFPIIANIIEGGNRENVSSCRLAGIGYSAVLYPSTLLAAKIKSVREVRKV
ncbi:hypothetical protein BDV19DRAFT_389550 [Aspergillus venezuelensis]